MEKPYKYDEWLNGHINKDGIVNTNSILIQYATVVSKLQVDDSQSMKGVINNATLYINYFISTLIRDE